LIRLTKLNGQPLIVNADLIETIEQTPDTVILLTTRNRLMVQETADEVVGKVLTWARSVRAFAPLTDSRET
jgi:flagellar protein FlbD